MKNMIQVGARTQMSLTTKEQHLMSLSEDEFRDKAIRPLLERLGFKCVRDTCGNDERGADALFLYRDPMGSTQVAAIQTKKGKLTMSRAAQESVVVALTQVRTMLEASYLIPALHGKRKPTLILLCASGRINNSAREHIHEEVRDPRVTIWDCNDVIQRIDESFPEFWWGVDESAFPYLRRLQEELMTAEDYIRIAADGLTAPITNENFVPLYLNRVEAKLVKNNGLTELEPEVLELTATSVVNRPERQILILGGPGSGKTTILRRIAFGIAEDSLASNSVNRVPVLLSARRIQESGLPLIEDIHSEASRLSPTGQVPFTNEDLLSGKLILLLDGLDEIEEIKRDEIAVKLDQYLEAFPRSRVIASSRSYRSVRAHPFFSGFYHYMISDMSLSDAAKIVDKSSKGESAPKHTIKEVLRRLQDVHGIGLSPLLVSVFVAGNDFSRSDVPANITEVFKKYSEMLLGRWDGRKRLREQHETQRKDFLLQQLALHMHCSRKTKLRASDVRELFLRELSQIDKASALDGDYDEIVHRSGLLRFEDSDLVFSHHLMQEFFAGRAVTDAKFFSSVVQDDWWRAPMLFFYGEHPKECATLKEVALAAEDLTLPELFESAVSIGLASQACHLSSVDTRADVLEWVVRALSLATVDHEAIVQVDSRFRLMGFLTQYLMARDSVAGEVMDRVADRLLKVSQKQGGDSTDDLEWFWTLVGLIEAGHVELAEKFVKGFDPLDERLLLGIDLGCYMVAHLRLSHDSKKKSAKRISDSLSKKVPHLRGEIFREFRTHLLELRSKQVSAIGATSESDE